MTAPAITARPNPYVLQDTAAGDAVLANNPIPLHALQHLTFFFSDADDNELFLTPPGTIACAWQPNGVTDLTTVTVGSTGILFDSSANSSGWLHVLARGTLKVGSTTIDAPVAQGTSGHVRPRSTMFLNHRSATPNTLTSGRHVNKLGLKLKIFEVASSGDNDVWTNESERLCPGIVAVAWQANTSTEDVNVTQKANGDVVFNSTAGSSDFGWLWAWTK